ncbi:hypothetical protein EAH80_04805 [Mycobacterium hodleri]|uniref:Uncharacterized protein n=1 Tax=Mycolicibacterium hodleri TaxID=49897 RepID=A0A502EKV6_9MYCO|nr:hypothetical protein EAH80_04805 [Mycolicibacterium hodleri]
MARRDHATTVVYLHLMVIQIHPYGRPYNLDSSRHFTPDDADRPADDLRAKAELVRIEGNRST